MDYRFSKRIIKHSAYTDREYSEHTKVYNLFENGKTVGKMVMGPNEKTIEVETGNYDIEDRSFMVKMIVEKATDKEVGRYLFPAFSGWFGVRDKLVLDEKEPMQFKENRLLDIFKKATWGQNEFELTNAIDSVLYQFKMDLPFIRLTPLPMFEFSGKIETTSDNKLLLLAGCCLVEWGLEKKEIVSNTTD